MSNFMVFMCKELCVNVPVAIFLGTVDYRLELYMKLHWSGHIFQAATATLWLSLWGFSYCCHHYSVPPNENIVQNHLKIALLNVF